MLNLLLIILISSNVLAARATFIKQGRSYQFVSPAKNKEKRPLLVLLHGCKQNADIIIEGTRLEQEALKKNFYILAPEQSQINNLDHCWNWFFSQMQTRHGLNEMSEIISTIDDLVKFYQIDRSKIFVAGLSAGAALAENLIACYPDYFSAAAIHSGLAFKVAEDAYEAQRVITSRHQKSPEYLARKAHHCAKNVQDRQLKKVLVIHGLDDKRVPSFHSELIADSHEMMIDLLDDGVINHSDSPIVSERIEQFPNGFKAHITDKKYKSFSERYIFIKGLQHAWGGGKAISRNFDPEAPSSNSFILNFFNL
jgi:poly(hydroxyalkanoate) depolymerase family esterase